MNVCYKINDHCITLCSVCIYHSKIGDTWWVNCCILITEENLCMLYAFEYNDS